MCTRSLEAEGSVRAPRILVVVGRLERTHPLFSVRCNGLRLPVRQGEWQEPKEVVLPFQKFEYVGTGRPQQVAHVEML